MSVKVATTTTSFAKVVLQLCALLNYLGTLCSVPSREREKNVSRDARARFLFTLRRWRKKFFVHLSQKLVFLCFFFFLKLGVDARGSVREAKEATTRRARIIIIPFKKLKKGRFLLLHFFYTFAAARDVRARKFSRTLNLRAAKREIVILISKFHPLLFRSPDVQFFFVYQINKSF